MQEGFPSKFWANMIAVVLPFVVAILFYGGSVCNGWMEFMCACLIRKVVVL